MNSGIFCKFFLQTSNTLALFCKKLGTSLLKM